MWTESAYTSVFRDSGPSADSGRNVRLDTARNEFEAAQIVLRGSNAYTISKVAFTDLASGSHRIAAKNLSYNFVKYVNLNANSVFGGNQEVYPVVKKAPGLFPDALSNDPSIDVPAGATQPIWVKAFVPRNTPGGLYRGLASVDTTAGRRVVPIEVDVRPVTIPDTKDGSFTNVMWTLFFGDLSYEEYPTETVKKIYGFDRYSDQWWKLMDNVAKVMKDHRTNNLTIPMVRSLLDSGTKLDAGGTYQFDWSRFDQVVQFFLDRGGIKRLEGFWMSGGPHYWSHWDTEIIDANGKRAFVPWDSPEATRWIDQYVPALKAHLEAKGWTKLWWMHIGDEPQGDWGQEAWTGIAKRIRALWPDVRLGDAAFHEPWASRLAEQADILIPNTLNYNSSPQVYDAEHAKGKELWLYNCNIPVANFLNRFIDQPQWNQRLTMWYAYSRDATGYLHWAFSNWQYLIDKQDVKGDGNITWPDPKNNTIESTVRYESLRDGIEDYEVLKLAKAKDLAQALVTNGNTYSPDTAYMQRIRRLALDTAAGRTFKDLARTAAATASSGDAKAAIDGDPGTAWQPSGDGWLQLDLRRQTLIDLVRIGGEAKLKVSYDGSTWTDTNGHNVKGRYLRLETSSAIKSVEVAGTPLASPNLAGGRAYELSDTTAPRFPDSTGREATDGVLAEDWGDGKTFGFNVTNSQTRTAEFKLDLGSAQTVGRVKMHAYEEYPDYRPDQIKVLTSVDGQNYTERGTVDHANGTSGIWFDIPFTPAAARYVKLALTKTGRPNTDVMFLDDVEVYRR